MLFRRTQTRLLALVLLTLGVVSGIGMTASAEAATVSTLKTSADQLPWQTNGRVAAIVTVGDTLYLGGDFTCVRPFGTTATTDCATNPTGGQVPRSRLAAFSVSTGKLLDWNPGASNSVYTLAASPDGSTIYAGGNFGKMGASARKHFAAVDAASGAVKSLVENTDYKVHVITATSTGLYLGGSFTTVNGVPRSRVAAVDPQTGSLSAWAPSADSTVRAITPSPDGTSVYLGGEFTTVNGVTGQKNLAKVSAATGKTQPWTKHPGYDVWSIVTSADGSWVYVGGNGSGGHASGFLSDGTAKWLTQTDGGVQDVTLFDGLLYVGGHFDNVCVGDTLGVTSGFHCPTVSATRHKLLAVDPTTGALNDWNPGANSNLGVFALWATASQLHVGGDFTKIGGVREQGYGRFSRA